MRIEFLIKIGPRAAGAQRGQTLPFAALCLSVLFGFAAFGVDVGFLRYEQRVQQSATDSAAIAGAAALAHPDSNVTTAAQADAARNGFTNDNSRVFVTVTTPPSSGTYAGITNSVQVTVNVKYPAFFSAIFGRSENWITTTAVALLKANSGPDCLYVLKDTNTTALNGASVNMPNCGMIANGALTANGGSIDAKSIGVAGQITLNGSTFAQATPAPALEAPDPCAQIDGCRYLQSNPPSSTPCDQNNFLTNGGSSAYLNPGVYCGTTTFNGTSTINFNPGVYVFTGDVTSNGVQSFNGTDVTFIMLGSGTFSFNGSTANLSAPTTGNTAGVLFYAPTASNATVNGGPGSLSGLIYFPKANLTFNGSSNSYYVVVTGTLTQNGAISIASGTGGSLISEAMLVQ